MNPYAPKLTPEKAAELRRLREDGWGYQRLATRFDVSKASVANRCRAIGLGGVAFPRAARPRTGTGTGKPKPGYDGWRDSTRVSASERTAIRQEYAAGATLDAIARRWSRHVKTVRRIVHLVPAEDRSHLQHLFDFKRERSELDRAVDRGLCALTPGYRRVVEMAEAQYARRGRK
jgi:hypothetical protein